MKVILRSKTKPGYDWEILQYDAETHVAVLRRVDDGTELVDPNFHPEMIQRGFNLERSE